MSVDLPAGRHKAVRLRNLPQGAASEWLYRAAPYRSGDLLAPPREGQHVAQLVFDREQLTPDASIGHFGA